MAWIAKAGFVAASRRGRRAGVMASSERMDFLAPARGSQHVGRMPSYGGASALHLGESGVCRHCLPDDAIVAWVRCIDWQRDRWMGAWCGPDAMLGTLQLAPTRCPRTWELAQTVASPARRQGVATRLLATALCDPRLATCRRLMCHHGTPLLWPWLSTWA